MASGFGEPMKPFSSNKGSNNKNGGFECNICFELAEDPIMTLCGHLYCWPCLYKWLRTNSHSHECLVCKALIEEEKLVPIYGRGKTSSDNPRCRSISGVEIPNRPAGRRPQTALSPPPSANYVGQGDGLVGGIMPMANGSSGNLTMSSAFGGLVPFLNLEVNGLNYTNVYGTPTVSPYWFPGPFHGGHFHGGHFHGFHRLSTQGRRQSGHSMKMWFLFVALAVIFYLITS